MAMGPWKGRKSHPRLAAILVILALLFGATAVTVGTATPAAADTTPEAVIGMPFTGKWAWNVGISPPYTDENSSHPSVHHTPGGGDWATDIYASEGTAVRLMVPYATAALSFSWGTSSTSCGTSTRLNVFVGGTNVGWLYFAHLQGAVTSGALTNGMTLGTVHNWGGCNPGTHVHVEFHNTTNHSCYVDLGNPGSTNVPLGDAFGVLGSSNAGTREACDSVPSGTTTPTDPSQLGVSVAFNPTNGQPMVAAQGPNNSLYVYWQTSSGSWAGPLGIGGAGSTYSAPSVAFNPVTGSPVIAARGPGSRLWIYWQNANGSWSGPLGVGAAGSTYTAPALAFSPSGNPTIAVQGPSNTLWTYWTSGSSWVGPLGVGASGSTFSAPSIAFNPVSGLPTVAVQGPSNTLRIYWQLGGGAWTGPLGVGVVGSTFTTPSLAFNASGQVTIAAQGPSNSLYVYWQTSSGSWAGPLGVGASSSTYSAPSIAFNTGAAARPTIAAQGPSNTLRIYWQQTSGVWTGPLGIAGSGSTYSMPSIAFSSTSSSPTIVTEGPSHSLWAYWSSSGSWYGPLGIGGVGSTYH